MNAQISTDGKKVVIARRHEVPTKQSHNRRLAQILLVIILFVSLSGCGHVSEGTLSEILERDPSFKKVLEAKKRLNTKILALENKKQSLDAQIALLKQEANPDIEMLQAKLESVRSEYKLNERELKDSISSLKNIRRLLERKSKLLLTGDEISVWNKRIGDLEKKINSLHNELDRLKSQTRLIKTEIKILKQ
ncbi:MAG: hypothetical protein JSV93_04295 [Candidatus Omnitrophota bacterium]|nr:MAG: hypothetical protein JSV93_04295 [Candidatus Omnitrophota bacterium]